MSWTKKINHPSAMFKKGDDVRAVVLSVDQEKRRVALGLRQLEDDPWAKTIPEKYHQSDIVTGTVTKLTNFGAFIEVDKELEGLLHISEMSEKKIEKPEEILKVGDQVKVMIINIDLNERKIGLSMRNTAGVIGATPVEDAEDPGAAAAAPESNEASREDIDRYTKKD